MGVSYKKDKKIFHNKRSSEHEKIYFKELPYHLIDIDNKGYRRANTGKLVFSLYSSIGCPYHCSFCIHPEVYNIINNPKWYPISPEEVVDHIEYAINKFNESIDSIGYPDAGYKIWLIQEDSSEIRFMIEGLWPNQAIYDEIHNHQLYKDAQEKIVSHWDGLVNLEYHRFTLVK